MKGRTRTAGRQPNETMKEGLRESVQLALGDLAGAARDGLLVLSVGVGLGVMHELMAAAVEETCNPKGKHNPERTATRWRSETGSVTFGGHQVPVGASADVHPGRRTVDPAAQLGALCLA